MKMPSDQHSFGLPQDIEEAVYAVLEMACDKKLRLVTAESCTGGLISSALTDVPGKSHAFERGFVTYTDEAKSELLKVPMSLIANEGAVSAKVAKAMAEGALAASQGDISVAVTGYAGNTGADGEPGLVHFAAARHGSPTVHTVKHYGDNGRSEVRVECLREALRLYETMMR